MKKKLFCLALGVVALANLVAQPQISSQASYDTSEVVTDTKTILNITEKKLVPANTVFPNSYKQHTDWALPIAEKYIRERRNYIEHTYKKGKKYYKDISKILKKYNLPDELKVLVAIESDFNPNELSKAGALGWWQFMDATAIEFGLKIKPRLNSEQIEEMTRKNDTLRLKNINNMVDERTNLTKSTHAAAKYLKQKYKSLNDWLLAIASYNAGEGTVRRAMRKSGQPNPNFWNIKPYLPTETQNYVIKFIGITAAYNNIKNFDSRKMTFTPTESITKRTIILNKKPVFETKR